MKMLIALIFPLILYATQNFDVDGYLISETFPNGKKINISYDSKHRITSLSLGDLGEIRYHYDSQNLLQVIRVSPTGILLYSHRYHYDQNDFLASEELIGNLGNVNYSIEKGLVKEIITPYSSENYQYDLHEHLISYSHNIISQEYNYTLEEDTSYEESFSSAFDPQGQLVGNSFFDFFYNDQGQLIKASNPNCEIYFTYDNLGRRISKTSRRLNYEEIETYLYFGMNEIATFDTNQQLKQIRIPGLSIHQEIVRPIAIETCDSIYAPIHNIQGNIIQLVNIQNQEVISLPHFDPFGDGLSPSLITPWAFAGKFYDTDVRLLYFGHRYYDPLWQIWITPDPMKQGKNPHQYCLGNPLALCDPTGLCSIPFLSIIWGAGAVITSPLWGPYALTAAAAAATGYLGYKAVQKANELMEYQRIHQNPEHQLYQLQRSKKGGVDPSLPKDPFKHPDWQDVSHAQQKKNGIFEFKNKHNGDKIRFDKGKPGEPGHEGKDHYHKYNPKARTWRDEYLDKDGNPVPRNCDSSHLYPA